MVDWLIGHDCPFIVCMTYAFHTPDKLCFILDLMNGGDLHYHLSQVLDFFHHIIFSVPERNSAFLMLYPMYYVHCRQPSSFMLCFMYNLHTVRLNHRSGSVPRIGIRLHIGIPVQKSVLFDWKGPDEKNYVRYWQQWTDSTLLVLNLTIVLAL